MSFVLDIQSTPYSEAVAQRLKTSRAIAPYKSTT